MPRTLGSCRRAPAPSRHWVPVCRLCLVSLTPAQQQSGCLGEHLLVPQTWGPQATILEKSCKIMAKSCHVVPVSSFTSLHRSQTLLFGSPQTLMSAGGQQALAAGSVGPAPPAGKGNVSGPTAPERCRQGFGLVWTAAAEELQFLPGCHIQSTGRMLWLCYLTNFCGFL